MPLCVLRASLCRRQAKIQWTQVGLHRSEPRLSGTARPSSPICRGSVRNAGLQSSVVVVAWICSVEMTKRQRRLRTVSDSSSCPVRERTSSLVTNFVQWMLRMRLRHQLCKEDVIFLDKVLVTDNASAPTVVPTIPQWTLRSISQSIGTRKRSGAMAHPCLTPPCSGNQPEQLPSTRTQLVASM